MGQPSVEDTIAILRGLKPRYDAHHGVRIQDAALVAAATLSHRYIPDRQLPDKAIDLVDEAASRLRIENDSLPQELDEIRRKITQLQIEQEALKKERDEASKRQLELNQRELAELQEKNTRLTAQWEAEKGAIEAIKSLKVELERKKSELDEATRRGNLEAAARIRYGELPGLEKELRAREEKLAALHAGGGGLLREEVTADEVAEVVSKWTGVPVARLLEGEKEKLLRMEDRLHARVVGQDEAIRAVSDAVRRARAGLSDPNRPVGSFLFLGPTGVGKTELCKALAEFLFDDENAMTRIDMSEYHEKHTVSRLIGAPPGYVGYEEGGQLTEAVRRRPYQVILFDEIEKADPEVFNSLLQVLDEGRLTDGQGRTVDFKNTVIIMTSNVGTEFIRVSSGLGFARSEQDQIDEEEMRRNIEEALKRTFRPEFLNRIDEVIIFHSLSREELLQIVEMQIREVGQRLSEQGITIVPTPAAKELLVREGYNPVYGARPLRRTIQRLVETPLSRRLLKGEFSPGDTIVVDAENGEIVFRCQGPCPMAETIRVEEVAR